MPLQTEARGGRERCAGGRMAVYLSIPQTYFETAYRLNRVICLPPPKTSRTTLLLGRTTLLATVSQGKTHSPQLRLPLPCRAGPPPACAAPAPPRVHAVLRPPHSQAQPTVVPRPAAFACPCCAVLHHRLRAPHARRRQCTPRRSLRTACTPLPVSHSSPLTAVSPARQNER